MAYFLSALVIYDNIRIFVSKICPKEKKVSLCPDIFRDLNFSYRASAGLYN